MFSDVDIASALKKARVAAGLTQEQLARKCPPDSVTTGTISKIERGDTRMPDFLTVAHIARALGPEHQRAFVRDIITAALEMTDSSAVAALEELSELGEVEQTKARRAKSRAPATK
jgi:transcriptional regulator with XRE-family HTH domain